MILGKLNHYVSLRAENTVCTAKKPWTNKMHVSILELRVLGRKILVVTVSLQDGHCEACILHVQKHTTVKSHKLTIASVDTNTSGSLYINFEFIF